MCPPVLLPSMPAAIEASPDSAIAYALLVCRTIVPSRLGTRVRRRCQLKNPNMRSHTSALATVRSLQHAMRAIVAWHG